MDALTVFLFTPFEILKQKVNISTIPGNNLIEKDGYLAESLRPGFSAREFIRLYIGTDDNLHRNYPRIEGLYLETSCALQIQKFDGLNYFLALSDELYLREVATIIRRGTDYTRYTFYMAHRSMRQLDEMLVNTKHMCKLLITTASLTNVIDLELLSRIPEGILRKYLASRQAFVVDNIRYVSTEGISTILKLYDVISDHTFIQLLLVAAAREAFDNYTYESQLKSVEELAIEKISYVILAAVQDSFTPEYIMEFVIHDARGFMVEYQALIAEATFRLFPSIDIDEIYNDLNQRGHLSMKVSTWYQNKKRVDDV